MYDVGYEQDEKNDQEPLQDGSRYGEPGTLGGQSGEGWPGDGEPAARRCFQKLA